jgi:hypothetical protein
MWAMLIVRAKHYQLESCKRVAIALQFLQKNQTFLRLSGFP